MMPNFLVVGVPKAGTSSIYHYLNQHPQVYMSPFKEPHFFSFEGECKPDWGITDLESYHSLFNGTENEVAFGEASTWYLYSQTAAERIKHHIPNVKIIMMLRNPIDRAYSSFLFNIQCGWESISDFEEALHLESSRISNNESWDFHYLNAGLYYDQIQRYYNLFPKNQINIFLYEDFKCDSLKVINDIFNFLGVDHSFIPNISQIHNATAFQKNSHINSFFESKNVLKTVLKKYGLKILLFLHA
jgi:hypothetical protein